MNLQAFAQWIWSVPTPVAAFVAVFCVVIAMSVTHGSSLFSRITKALLLAIAAGGAVLAMGWGFGRADLGNGNFTAPTGKFDQVIALVLTALTGFAIFFFSRAHDDIKTAHRDAQNTLEAMEKRVLLNERVDTGLRRIEVELMRARLVRDLSDDVRRLQDAIHNLAESDDPIDQTRRTDRQVTLHAVTRLRRAVEPDRSQRFDGGADKYEGLLQHCVENVRAELQATDARTLQLIPSINSLKQWLSLIVDEFNEVSNLRDLAREVRDLTQR